MPHQLYIGLMSGTSADAIDAVLVDLQFPLQLVAQHTLPLPVDIKQQIHALSLPGNNEIDRMGALDAELHKAMTSLAGGVEGVKESLEDFSDIMERVQRK